MTMQSAKLKFRSDVSIMNSTLVSLEYKVFLLECNGREYHYKFWREYTGRGRCLYVPSTGGLSSRTEIIQP